MDPRRGVSVKPLPATARRLRMGLPRHDMEVEGVVVKVLELRVSCCTCSA